jgi:hypothetical protein
VTKRGKVWTSVGKVWTSVDRQRTRYPQFLLKFTVRALGQRGSGTGKEAGTGCKGTPAQPVINSGSDRFTGTTARPGSGSGARGSRHPAVRAGTDSPVPVDVLGRLLQDTHRCDQCLPGLGGLTGPAMWVGRGVGGGGHPAHQPITA